MRFKRRSHLPLYNYTGEMRSLVIARKIRSFRFTGWLKKRSLPTVDPKDGFYI